VHLAYTWIVSHLSAKNYRNLWKFDEVLTKTNVLSFFWDTVYLLPSQLNYGGTVCSGVARICCGEGQSWKLCHGALTADFGAGCSSCSMTNSFVTNAVLIERAVSC